MRKQRVGSVLAMLMILLGGISLTASSSLHGDAFRLSSGELIIGELLSFDGAIFTIETDKGIIQREKNDVVAILIGIDSSVSMKSLSQWASEARASSEYSSSNWSAKQATGEPNTSTCGDNSTAWAPKSRDSEPEWLELTFDTPVYAVKLRVHETYNSGFIYRVEFVDVYGQKYTVWQGKDTTACPGWFELNTAQTRYLVKSVILHTQINGYEEIDAVELTGLQLIK